MHLMLELSLISLALACAGDVPGIASTLHTAKLLRNRSLRSLSALLLVSNPVVRSSDFLLHAPPSLASPARRKGCARAQMSLLPANQPWAVSAGLAVCGSVGTLVAKTPLGVTLSPPVSAMAIGAILANLGVFPSAADCATIGAAQSLCVRFATPLLLLGADMRTVAAKSGQLLKVFLAGSLCSMLGASLGYHLFLSGGGIGLGVAEARKLAAALAAKNIGGGLNYVAMCETLKLSSTAQAIGLTVDNIGALIYFPLCNFLGRNIPDPGGDKSSSPLEPTKATKDQLDKNTGKVLVDVADLSVTLALTTIIVALGEAVWPAGSLITSTILATTLATVFPQRVGRLAACGDLLGALFLFVFFATAGVAGGSVGPSLVGAGPAVAGYLVTLYIVNLAVLLGVGHLLGISRPLSLTASNANIGGPATASAFCIGQGWTSLTTPALLVGTFGNVIANFLALWLHWLWSGGSVLNAIGDAIASRLGFWNKF